MFALSISVLCRAWVLQLVMVGHPVNLLPNAFQPPPVPAIHSIIAPEPPPVPLPALVHPRQEWWYHPHKDHTPSGGPEDVHYKNYPVSFLGNTARPVVYLTFDEGSETGCTPAILDTLSDNGVHAAFFATRYYLKSSPELVRRMLDEGHVVANHSATHPDLSRRTDAQVREEILATARYFKEMTGREMPALFRPPMGVCDERILRLSGEVGWRCVFWSMAYADWLPEQKGPQYAVDYVMKYHHPGAIILLHPYPSNTAALCEIITRLRSIGYEFGSLLDLK